MNYDRVDKMLTALFSLVQCTYPRTPAFYLPPGPCHHQSSVIWWLRIICYASTKERKKTRHEIYQTMALFIMSYRLFVKQTNLSLGLSSFFGWTFSASSFGFWTAWGLLLMRNRFSGMGGISSGRTVDVTTSSCSFSSALSASDLMNESIAAQNKDTRYCLHCRQCKCDKWGTFSFPSSLSFLAFSPSFSSS